MTIKTDIGVLIIVGCMVIATSAQAAERQWDLRFENFFRDQTKPLFIYAREDGGAWLAGVGSSRDPDRQGGKTYNRSWYYADLSGAPIKDGKMQGKFTFYVTPDNWVPSDHRGFTIDFEIDADVDGDKMKGTYKVLAVNTKAHPSGTFPRKGHMTGEAKVNEQPALPNPVTFDCNLQGALVGGDPTFGDRCLVLQLGAEDGRLISGVHASMSQKFEVMNRKPFDVEGGTITADKNTLKAHVVLPTKTLDMDPCQYEVDLNGCMLGGLLVGSFKLVCKIDGKDDVVINGSFDGNVRKGAKAMKVDKRPWFSAVEGFAPPDPGEHPRLLFRKSDLEMLRKKMDAEEGKAILVRLRHLLDGKDGETMTTVFSSATKAYMPKEHANPALNTPGVYTISHAAGYGLLYQLTGDKKYAEFGKQCFEKALEGVRDRDDRYSFKESGGALRSGPSLGWYAVGYDLCYGGWDRKTREKFGRAMLEFKQGDDKGKSFDVEALARGTMPPGSNHFGMQVGGMSFLLLALDKEPWLSKEEQEKVDVLLQVVQESMIRNVVEGFGDGGFFAEGDGTGSMASHIVYLSALQGWRNAKGMDFTNVERPNVRMTALKWIYGTVIRGGSPDFWPIRGTYGHNVWSRAGLSGGGYIAHGFGAVTDEQKPALKWFYNHLMRDTDAKAGKPYDTASNYPHVAVSAFVNWPTDMKERNPTEVLPLCYRDSHCDFFLWRNRWQDDKDTVISVLLNRTSGYMAAKTDRQLCLNTGGQHVKWGTAREGKAKYWWMSKMGEASSLTMADGTCLAVDFTGAGGADIMLVTTGKAEGQAVKVGKKTLTFHFPTTQTPPEVEAKKEAAVVGKQKVSLEDGNLVLAVTER